MGIRQEQLESPIVQAYLAGFSPLEEAIAGLAAAGTDARGAIYTRPEVVNFILDLVGYTSDRPLHEFRLLEPSFGAGDFLLAAAERLLENLGRQKDKKSEVETVLRNCIRGVELHHDSFQHTRSKLLVLCKQKGVSGKAAESLADAWLIQGDYLLTPFEQTFTHVIGNPPYVRQELIPDVLMSEYRKRFQTIYDRADIYIPFIEKSLRQLSPGGALGFICADRWMKNRYGGPLRRMVADYFHFRTYVDMVDTPAFLSDVIAYPAITIIANEKSGPTRIAHRPEISSETLAQLARELLGKKKPHKGGAVKELANVAVEDRPWILESSDQLALVRRLECDFPTIEEAGCKVGIGVATGADAAFIGPYDELDVEPDRKLPLVKTRDIESGEIQWRGLGVINPFGDDGKLVDLNQYPKLKAYLEERKSQIARRHVAKKVPQNWYRTIDRIYPHLAKTKKLLIPDIKGEAHIVYEDGQLYPHHNLYYLTSESWDLRALRAVLMSGIARLFVATYSTKMRGGFLRYQAQYLRRIRLPRWNDVPDDLKQRLIGAAIKNDIDRCNQAAFEVYGLTAAERSALGGNGV